MSRENFLKALDRRKPAVIDENKKPFSIGKLKRMKKLTGYIQFPCKFDNEGRCNLSKEGKAKWTENSTMCCCKDCKDSCGYLNVIFKDDINHYVRKWSNKTGFWRKGKGCVLDRDKRSITCLNYVCENSELRDCLEAFSTSMKKLEIEIERNQYYE